MPKGEAFRGTSRRTPLGSITTMRGERGMGSNARRQGGHAESPPGAIQHAMVGKLRPEVKHLKRPDGHEGRRPTSEGRIASQFPAKAASGLTTGSGLNPF